MQGRFHFYEGYTIQEITFPNWVIKELGIEYLLLRNAGGGMNLSYNYIPLHKGIYAAVMRPNLETRAEYRYLTLARADMLGMSTVPEVIVANHIGLSCAAISVITDECDPENRQPVDIREIIAMAGKADLKLSRFFSALIKDL